MLTSVLACTQGAKFLVPVLSKLLNLLELWVLGP